MADVYKQSFKQNYTNNIELSIFNCGLAGCAALQTTVEDGKFNIIGVALLERLFINVCHCGSLPPVRFLVPVYHNCPCKFNKSTSYSLGWTPKITFFAG